ncbi:MAG: hypothetical protein IT580_04130 [Verrucomicrobiales bacterium]|nr:hypothetical protein [Verrucomicrobiales bacterium]
MRPPAKSDSPAPAAPGPAPSEAFAKTHGFLPLLLALAVILGFLFRNSFNPDLAMFANDGPLGAVAWICKQGWSALTGVWADLNWLGANGGNSTLGLTTPLAFLLGAWGFINFYSPLMILLLGLAAWWFLRRLNFSPGVCIVGGIAAALNTDFFSYACWGLGTLTLCVACAFVALGFLAKPVGPRWTAPIFAGAALGLALVEGFDNGAIFSLYIAAFAIFGALNRATSPTEHAPTAATGPTTGKALVRGLISTAVIAAVSAIIAAQVLGSTAAIVLKSKLAPTTDANPNAGRTANWYAVTQWSLPPWETLRAAIPGLYGYRMDTPNGGKYWGRVGSSAAWDEYFATSPRDPSKAPKDPGHSLRYSGAGHYTGVPVLLLGAFAIAAALRKREHVLSDTERRWVWFWAVAALLSLLFSFGRFTPFYRIIYALPGFDTIRNPVKFLHPLNVALVILSAYGLQALWRGWIISRPAGEKGASQALGSWWSRASSWERAWGLLTITACAAAFVAWMAYGKARPELLQYLADVGFEKPDAAAIARFSHQEVGMFVVWLSASVVLILLCLSGWFSRNQGKSAIVAFAAVVALDLARANAPWILHYNWRDRYAPNVVLETLRAKPYEGRVTGNLPFGLGGQAGELQRTVSSVCGGEWAQHQFRYYDIQTLDIVQMPRTTADFDAFNAALDGQPLRRWELTNTRYFLSLAPIVDGLNQQIDPVRKPFRLTTPFTLEQTASGAIRANPSTNGPFAVVEYTAALPRVMLFDQWRSQVADDEALQTIASTNFNPHASVLVAEQIPAPSVTTSSQPAGTASFKSYQPRHITLETEARTPCVLLLNDRHDADWRVLVNGKEEPLLRANFIMRGVYLPAGKHTVEFKFQPPLTTLWVSLGAWLGVGAVGLIAWRQSRPTARGS